MFSRLPTVKKVGVVLSAIATVLGVAGIISFFFNNSSAFGVLCPVALVMGIVSYILVGGIGKAIKGAFGVAKTGWCVIPVFPMDLLLAIAFFLFAVLAFLQLPLFFAWKNIKEAAAAE